MSINKTNILDKICYTELVYKRINKKLNLQLSELEIEKMIFDTIQETQEKYFQNIGKNIYITNKEKNIRITINQNTNRIITVEKVSKS
ncbi:MAG: DUF3781 domain-containing protein [Ginsengibacter sp.]